MSNETRTATIIANHKNENVRFETDAATFGELKQEPEAEGLFSGNIRVIVRENRNELSMEDSKLPDGGFTLIVVADKVKSGSDKYDEMGYHELRSECIDRGFDTDKYNGAGVTANIMRAHLRDDDESGASASTSDVGSDTVETVTEDEADEPVDSSPEVEEDEDDEPSEETSDRFEEMKSRIDDAVKNCREEVNDIMQEYADILPDSVIPDYSETVSEIKDELGLN